ncbi:MAG TPA: hypothetical protein VF629_05115 [Hymenobacter sp.]|jgi:hypothetical protein|uniref:hypothetical protein n=1 Tax=Hymenobacter sp. TaxID=1898978 RepID=UPI002ED94561
MGLQIRGATFLFLWLVLASGCFAQQIPSWPRDASTGRIEFAGMLLWPTPTASLAQKQALLRRWYAEKLTTQKPEEWARWENSEITYAELPTWACIDSVSNPTAPEEERVIWRLCFQIRWIPTPMGVSYKFTEFECIEIVFDASTSGPLEEVLLSYSKEQAVFRRRVRWALASW